MTKASDNNFPKVLLDMQTSAPTAPSDADWKMYAKPGGIYARSSNSEIGPFGSGGALTDHTHAVTGSGATGGGATLSPTTLTPTGKVGFDSGIDSTVNADQNDFNPASLHTVSSVRFTSFTANRTVTGMDAGSTGEAKFLINNTSFSLLLTNESGSSAAANRFRSPNATTTTVRQSGMVLVIYFAGRWTVLGI